MGDIESALLADGDPDRLFVIDIIADTDITDALEVKVENFERDGVRELDGEIVIVGERLADRVLMDDTELLVVLDEVNEERVDPEGEGVDEVVRDLKLLADIVELVVVDPDALCVKVCACTVEL